MPLFSQNPTSFRDGVKDLDSDRSKHLEKMVVSGRAVGRAPEMTGTTVVFLPYPDFDNPNYKAELAVLPDRLSDDPMDYGRWLYFADGVSRFGKNPVTILFDDPDDAGFVPAEHNPVHMIYYAVDRALHAKSVIETPFGSSESDNWELLLKGKWEQKIFPVISRPDQLIMSYALVYSSGKKSYILEGAPYGAAVTDPPVIFVMSRYATTKSMVPQLDALDQRTGKLMYPDVTGVRFVHFYDRKKNDCPAMRNAMAGQTNALGGGRRMVPTAGGAEAQGTTLGGYGVYVTDTYTGLPDAPKLNRADVVRLAVSKLRPWEETLRGHTPEASARLIAEYCGLPMSVLWYAWKSMPQYYTDDMKARAKSAVTVGPGRQPMAGFGVPQQAAPPPAAGVWGQPSDAVDPFDAGAPADEPASDPGAAPWGGHISDPAAGYAEPAGSGPPEADAAAAYDPKVVAESNAKLRQFMAAQQNNPAANRSAAAQTKKK